MRLGTVDRDGMPRVVPIWFQHDAGKLWFTPRGKSAWLDDLRASAAVCCTIDEPRALYSLALADAATATWRMPVRDGENPLAVWGRQYYHR
ncbi:MAG: pyridoxamine 5'-phosphate oxidase family protein [Actinomycetota bacterium]